MSSYVGFLLAYLFHGSVELAPEVSGRSAASRAVAANASWPASDKSAWMEQVDEGCTLLVSKITQSVANLSAPPTGPPAAQRPSAGDLTEALQALRQALEEAKNASQWESAGQRPRAEQLADCYEQLKVQEYYGGYDIFVGLRIASSLTILFAVFILFVVYKTGCHVDRRRRRQLPVAP